MLPTKGYFQDIECPYFDNSCGRPYCHFRHKKKNLNIADESLNEEVISKEVPTYKPTPKSELAVSRSHIPISYVPDIVYRTEKPSRSTNIKTSFLSKPTYKPTPISLLTSVGKDAAEDIIQHNLINRYTPKSNNTPTFEYKPTTLDDKITEDHLDKHEYKPTGENSNNVQYKPTALEDISDHNSSEAAYKPTSDNTPTIAYKPTEGLSEIPSLNLENLDTEFDMIDEIIMSDEPKITKNVSDEPKTTKNVSDEPKIKIVSDEFKIKKNEVEGNEDTNTGNSKQVVEIKDKTEKDKKVSSKGHKHSKDRDSKSSSKKSEDRHKHKSSESEKKHKDEKREESKHKTSTNRSNSDEKKEKVKHKDKSKGKDGTKEKKKDERDKSKGRVKSSEKSKSKDKHKSSSSRDNSHTKKSDKDKSSSRERDKIHKKESSKEERIKKHEKKHKSQDNIKSDLKEETGGGPASLEELEELDDFSQNIDDVSIDESETMQECFKIFSEDKLDELDFKSEDETMQECFRIFNEFKPEDADTKCEVETRVDAGSESLVENLFSKKRIAHSNAPSTSTKFQLAKPNLLPTPGEIMNNRFKLVKAMQANNEETMIKNEIQRVTKRPAPPLNILEAAKKHRLQKPSSSSKPVSLVDEIMNGHKNKSLEVIKKSKPTASIKPTSLVDEIIKSKTLPKKIAPVSNVMNIQRAKAQLEELNKKKASEQLNKTVAQTSKVGKRQAHIPEYSLADIPDVIDADKSKLPVNVRTRFLTLLGDECCKLYLSQAEAYKRALDEEYCCYQKCKVLVTYRNSAMLAVNRLRKELQEREQNGLGPLGSGESSKNKNEDSNKVTLYNQVENYLLTEDELDIHGYPKMSAVPGKAVIKNRKSVPCIPLPKNQKKCSRCSKIYLVDKNGKVIYEEECVYHPLKKRTIRGEQIYLCCKSSDEFGCCTSHTHVSEMSEDAELEGFQKTMPPESESDPRSNSVYALDCEMCYTTRGLELTRVTIVNTDCKTVYESLVKPLNEIIDYNTRFSGITKQQMDRINTGILQVQANILHLCNSRTILIGHSLESDMKALKIVHSTIVDTSVLFPHKMGLPHKRALRTLASDYLKKIIQNDVGGHDSAEDAITCMELVKWKVKEDAKFKFSK